MRKKKGSPPEKVGPPGPGANRNRAKTELKNLNPNQRIKRNPTGMKSPVNGPRPGNRGARNLEESPNGALANITKPKVLKIKEWL